MPCQVVPSTHNICQEDFPEAFFKSALRKEQWAGPFIERYVLNLVQAKSCQKAMLQQFISSTDKSYK